MLLVLLALLEAARNAGWQQRGVERVLEANRRAKEECGGSAASSKEEYKSSKEATASSEVRVGSGKGGSGSGVEGKKKA